MRALRSGAAGLALLALLGSSRPAAACGYGGIASPLERFALADCVVVGKITRYDDRTVRTSSPDGRQPMDYRVAVVKVEEMLKGDGRLTHVRIGMASTQMIQPGYAACFFLTEHPLESFYLQGADLYDFAIPKNQSNFAAQVASFRQMGRLLADPVAGLKAQRAEDRLLTAAMVLARARTFRAQSHVAANKTEPLDAQTSALVLKALAEADWNKSLGFRMNAWRLFNLLGVTAQDGWNPAGLRTTPELYAAAKQWLGARQENYRIAAYVRR